MNVTIKMSSNTGKKRKSSKNNQAQYVQKNSTTSTQNTTSTTPMMEYEVLYAVGGYSTANNLKMTTEYILARLRYDVSLYISEGWKPQGGVSTNVNKHNREVFAQAMVREREIQ